MAPAEIVSFWRNAGPAAWFKKNSGFDETIRARFADPHHAAARGEYRPWAETAEGALALLLLLDQFPRNLFRGCAHAFATDGLARAVARRALDNGLDREVEPRLRPFMYLPFEHSEDAGDQALGVSLCERLRDEAGDTDTLKWAKVHQDIIGRFGRFPHRNAALGRETTPEEQAFLDGGGFGG